MLNLTTVDLPLFINFILTVCFGFVVDAAIVSPLPHPPLCSIVLNFSKFFVGGTSFLWIILLHVGFSLILNLYKGKSIFISEVTCVI